jgi:hypothetical protein
MRCAYGPAAARRPPAAGRDRRQGQRDHELAAATDARAVRDERAAVRLHQARATVSPMPSPTPLKPSAWASCTNGSKTWGSICGVMPMPLSDTVSVRVSALDDDGQADAAALVRVLGRVVEQVADDLLQARHVTLHAQRAGRPVQLEALPASSISAGASDGRSMTWPCRPRRRSSVQPPPATGEHRPGGRPGATSASSAVRRCCCTRGSSGSSAGRRPSIALAMRMGASGLRNSSATAARNTSAAAAPARRPPAVPAR